MDKYILMQDVAVTALFRISIHHKQTENLKNGSVG